MFEAPSLEDVKRFVENGFAKAFFGTSGGLRVSVLKVIAVVVAGAVYMPILLCKKIFKNAFVSTCEVSFLDVHGAKYSLPHKPACFAHGLVVISGDVSTVVASGTRLREPVSGHEYELVGSATIGSGRTVEARVRATEIGNEFNLEAGVSLEFSEGLPTGIDGAESMLINGGAKVAIDLGDRTEYWGETAEEYRARLRQREQNQPQGGSDPDWWGWVMRFSTVNNCWVTPNWPYSNSVTLFVNNTNNAGGAVISSDIAEIQNYVGSDGRRPLTSRPVVVACGASTLSMTVVMNEMSDVIKSNVLDSLKNYLRTFGPGKTVNISVLSDIVRSASGDSTALAYNIKVDNVVKTGSFTLYKNLSGTTISGKVIDINNIQIQWVRP